MQFTVKELRREISMIVLDTDILKIGKPAGRFDTMIAAICINQDAMLSTLNRTHFERFIAFGLRLFYV